MKEKHKQAIYDLVQNTLDFCGNTLEASKEYCLENNLDWQQFENVRLKAIDEYYNPCKANK